MSGDHEQGDSTSPTQETTLRRGSVFIDGRPIKLQGYKIISELGRGANGIVFKAMNLRYRRYEALKFWLRMKPRDRRNKIEQGLHELNKLARASSPVVVQVNGWDIIDGHLCGFLEYIEGETLAESVYKYKNSPMLRIELSKMYLFRLRDMAKIGLFHGDPHLKNVMTYNVSYADNVAIGIKFLDFGVSHNYENKSAALRQKKIVFETIRKICKDIDSFEFCTRSMEWALNRHQDTDHIWHTYWTDALNGMRDLEFDRQYKKYKGNTSLIK